jgi:HK97 family phage major capsid protein
MTARPELINPEGEFRSLGEQLKAIVAAEQYGRAPDPRLHAIQRRAAIAPAGGSEQVPSDGGFLIAPNFSRDIVKRLYETGELFKRALQVPITNSNSFSFPQFDESSRANGSRLGGIQAYFDNEAHSLKPNSLAGTIYTQKPTFNRSEVVANKVTGYLHLTDELSMDTDAFGTWASYAFAEELMFVFENAMVNGTGAGEPLGILNSNAVIKVAGQVGQQSGTVVSQNIYSMLASFWARSYNSAGSIFIYNQLLLPYLASLATIVGQAGSESKMWVWCSSSDEYDRLAGFPALPSEYCATPGTTGDLVLLDMSRYIVAIREMMRAEISIHVRFISNESTFRFVMRAGGQPIDKAPVAALNGGNLTSPFVALQAR